MLILRKISFWLALAGLFLTVRLTLRLAAVEPIPPAPVAPASKPYASGGIGASGVVESRRENTLVGVPQAGLVQQVQVAVWDKVEAGQPLLQLDDRELRARHLVEQAQATQVEAEVAVAAAQLQRLQDQLTRLETLAAERVIAREDLDNRRNDVAVARAQLAAAQSGVAAACAAVQQTETLLTRLLVRAPIAGTILQVNVRAGEYIVPGAATAPLVLGAIDELQVRADVDEQIAPRVQAGRDAVGFLKGDTSHPIPMKFVRIEPLVVPKRSLTGASTERVDTRVLQVIFSFARPPERPVYVGQQLDLFLAE